MSRSSTFVITVLIVLGLAVSALADQAAPAAGRQGRGAQAQGAAPRPAGRPTLLFKEEWKQNERNEPKSSTPKVSCWPRRN